MARRPLALLALALAGALAIGACSGGSDDGAPAAGDGAPAAGDGPEGTLVVAAAEEPETLDFMASTQGNVHFRTINVVETLFAFDDEWAPQPLLADTVEASPDLTTYTITLRNVKLHNGDPLTSADVVASLERWMEVDGRAAGWMTGLESLEATDDTTVVFTFSVPKPLLPSYLATTTTGIIAASAAEAAGTGVLEPEQLIGTGPFMIDHWESGVELVLKAFPDYVPPEGEPSGHAGAREAGVEEIVYRPVLDESARLAGLQTGEFNYVESLPLDQLDIIESTDGVEVTPRIVGSVAAYLNTQDPVIGDPAMRRALLVALNMDEIAASLGPDELWELSPAIPSSGTRFASDAGTDDWNAGDPDRARSMAEQAGYDGEPLVVITTSTPATYRMAILLEEQLEKAGFTVEPQLMETAAMQERRSQPDGWHIAMGQINNVPDATQLSALSCGNTVGAYCSEEMNGLVSAFSSATSDSDLTAAHDAIQELFYQDLPYIKGPEVSDLNATYHLADFDPTKLNVPHLWNARLTQ
ncbi:ABC transporter substrate-binding protein [Jiangella mangrovi]|uniref:Peptide/nickel transport system substrate-binding protein n=1 Tax=Jiangella mangrovi TaxID=1524084 RepID=A0A7W9GRQ2_9ACTN|nr:ABC transporter substrate-binding protein [Jiangella mangrovi]MBB5788837.1 peptide/nickel transport system substrate-binding protein [Jiangella mangrovi]